MAELGLSFQSFQVSFEHDGAWVTTSWLKRVWEKVDNFGFVLSVCNLLSSFLQEGDDWLMARFIATGYDGYKLLILNRVRKHQQVLFLSDILGAGGGLVDKQYLKKHRQGERWSSTRFPCEAVTGLEMDLWQRAIAQVVMNGPVQASLDTFKTDGHKLWEWRVLEPQGHLFRKHKNRVEVYGYIRRGQYTNLCTSCSVQMRGVIATVEEITPGMVKVCSVASLPIRPIPPVNFFDVLRGWGKRGFGITSK